MQNTELSSYSASRLTKVVYCLPALICLCAVFAPRFMAYLPALFGIIGMVYCIQSKLKPVFFKQGYVFTLIVIALAALSSLWAVNPDFSIERTIKLALILLSGLLLPSVILTLKDRLVINTYHFSIAFFIPLLISTCFILFEYQTGLFVYAGLNPDKDMMRVNFSVYNRCSTIIFLLGLLTIALAMVSKVAPLKKITLCTLIFVTIITLFFATDSQTGQLGFLIGLLILMLFPVRIKALWIGAYAIIVLGTLSAPLLVSKAAEIDLSVQHNEDGVYRAASIPDRIMVWNYVVQETMKSPFIGRGIGSTRFIESEKPISPYRVGTTTLHPHNAVLQIWIEFGLLGILIFLVGLGYFLKKLYALHDPARGIILAMTFSYLAMSITGYGVWQSWLIGTLILYISFGVLIIQIFNTNEKNNENA